MVVWLAGHPLFPRYPLNLALSHRSPAEETIAKPLRQIADGFYSGIRTSPASEREGGCRRDGVKRRALLILDGRSVR